MNEEAIQTARENIDRLVTEMTREGQAVPEEIKKASEVLKEAEKGQQQQEIDGAVRALSSVKQQLEALAAGGKHPAATEALRAISSITITTIEDAKAASSSIAMAQKEEAAEAGGDLLKSTGELLGGAVSLAVAGAEKFGSLLGLDAKAMQGFKTIASADAGLQVVNQSEKMLNSLVANFTGNAPARNSEQKLG